MGTWQGPTQDIIFSMLNLFFCEKRESMEVEAVDGRLKEAEAKEKLTAVASLLKANLTQTKPKIEPKP